MDGQPMRCSANCGKLGGCPEENKAVEDNIGHGIGLSVCSSLNYKNELWFILFGEARNSGILIGPKIPSPMMTVRTHMWQQGGRDNEEANTSTTNKPKKKGIG